MSQLTGSAAPSQQTTTPPEARGTATLLTGILAGPVNLIPRMPRASGNGVLFRSRSCPIAACWEGRGARRLTRSGSAGTVERMEGS